MDEILARAWESLGGRVGGPLTFRLIIQPLVAGSLAIRDGLRDARTGRPAYLWAIVSDPQHRSDLLREGWKAVAKLFTFALVTDVVYQLIVERWVYPGELLVVTILLAIVPYLLIRGPVARIARAITGRPVNPAAE